MKKYFLLFLFGIACSGVYSQINEQSFSFSYTPDTTDIGEADTLVNLGLLEIEFSIDDTLNFKGVQVQLEDAFSNIRLNAVALKQNMISNGQYNQGAIDLLLGSFNREENYTLRLTYLNISGVNPSPVVKSITD